MIYRLSAFFVLFWLLFAVQTGVSSTAFAAARMTSQTMPTQNVARAGVSVVRLLVSYTGTDTMASNGNASIMCTGLGVLLASQRQNGQNASYENWVLTDGSLVNQDKATCLPSQPQAELTSITIFTSTAYNSQQTIQFNVPVSALSLKCQTNTPSSCAGGPAIFSFMSGANAPLPFIRLASDQKNVTQDSAPDQALVLARKDLSVNDLPTSSVGLATYDQQLEQFLTPTSMPLKSTSLNAGTPLINSSGDLTGLHLVNGSSPSIMTMRTFINSVIPQNNQQFVVSPVYEDWENGMDAFYQHTFNAAQIDFQKAYTANPNFSGAQYFASLSAQEANAAQQSGSSSLFSPTHTISVGSVSIQSWELALVALIILLLILAVFFTLLRMRIKRRRTLQSELVDAEKRATIEAQRIRMAEMESSHSSPQISLSGPLAAPQGSLPQPVPSGPLSMPMQRCPRCGELNSADSNYCGHCRQPLAPSPSGPLPFPGTAQVQLPFPSASPGTPVIPASPQPPAHSTHEQPTVVPVGTISEQPTIIPGNEIVDQPTVDVTPDEDQGKKPDLDKTLPYSRRRLNGRGLGFAVGTRSDPGIKRKYKPNEDSLFAAQGVLGAGTKDPIPFGLFVVADGMGGHANGRDASRLAIQSLINYLLPRINGLEEHQGDAYVNLLVQSIQEANYAVHHNNMDQHGDMGTTMTASLVVDGVAYVGNVGDSRTYLYRPGEGLRKVTTDHSVVASLVEAGIIKPDDIYTHPKRNQIYRSLGEKPVIEIDSFTVPLQADDKLLLCSDGLWDMVRDPKIESVVKRPDMDPSITGEALIHAALEGGGEDNVSVIVVHMNEPFEVARMPRIQLLAKPDSVQMPQL
jgi:serine/threonine protein phosphatase PrpC